MGLSIWQLLIILLIVVLLFGANRIPRLMGDVGKGIRSFRTGLKEEDDDSGTTSGTEGSRRVEQDSTEPVNRTDDNSSTTSNPGDGAARSS